MSLLTLRALIETRENVHLEGHPDWDAGYNSAMALVEAHVNAIERAVRELPEPTLGLRGGVNRKAVLDAIERGAA